MVKNLPANAGAAGDAGLIPESGRPPVGGNGNPLQFSCWDNPMDRGAWQATVHGVGKIPWRRKWQPAPVFMSRESHGQRSLADHSPQGCTELDVTEVT